MLEIPPLPDNATYLEKLQQMAIEFDEVGGPAAAVSLYATSKKDSMDFYYARMWLYVNHLVYFDTRDERGLVPETKFENSLGKSAMVGFVLQEMISDRMHPKPLTRVDRTASLYKNVFFGGGQKELDELLRQKTPESELKVAKTFADSAFHQLGTENVAIIHKWTLKLARAAQNRVVLMGILGATLQNSRRYHSTQLINARSVSDDVSPSI